jgi:hypothetical protein
MMKFIQEFHPHLKKRLHFIILVPDIQRALEETLRDREGKDSHLGMEDTKELLELQDELYKLHGETLDRWDFKVDFVDSFHRDGNVLHNVGRLIDE